MIRVQLKLFAMFREKMNADEMPLELDDGATVGQCFDRFCQRMGTPVDLRACTLLAVNQEYAAPSTRLKDGDEIAFIPPVAGG